MSGPGIEPIRQTRVHEQVASRIREQILSGQYEAGQMLPHERVLIDRFQVSRSAIRQAMQRLEQQGLVDVRVGSGGGCFVAPMRLDSVRESFTNLFALRGLDVQEFLAAKAEIEPTIFGAAARTITSAHLDQLRANLADCRQAVVEGDDDRVFVLSHDFHRVVARATGNQLLELVLSALVDVAGRIPNFRGRPSGGWDAVLKDHEEILDALREGDEAGVRRVSRRHADSVRSAFEASRDARAPR